MFEKEAEFYARKYINHKMAIHAIFELEVVQKDVTKLLVDFATEATKELKEDLEHKKIAIQTRKARIKELEKENALAKSLLYCSKRTCDNCGFVTCENFQRQRRSNPCALYISYQDRIKNLSHENDVLVESYNNSEMNLASISEQLAEATEIIRELLEWEDRSDYGEHLYQSAPALLDKAEQFLKECE